MRPQLGARMIVGTLAAVALGAIAGSAGSMNSAVRGTLVFERGTPSSFGSPTEASVYAVVLPGGEASRLIQNARDPSVSRDGASIAFTRSGIWAAASTGTNERQLTKNKNDYNPAWSPNGRTIFFSRWNPRRVVSAIFRVEADGTGIRQLTHPAFSEHCHESPAPSPGGRIVAFTDIGDCTHGIGRSIRAITPSGKSAAIFRRFQQTDEPYDLAWSPDGRSAAYATIDYDADVRTGVYVVHADGSHGRRVARGTSDWGGWPHEPAWSLDGQWIAFVVDVSTRDGNAFQGDLWIVRKDGSGLHRLTTSSASDVSPTWLRR